MSLPSNIGADCELPLFRRATDPRLNGLPGPMHVCLNVDELVRLIARELVALKGKASAVALAGSCKSFEDPVLDALWEMQELLLPLLKSLPGDVWKEGGCAVSVLTLHSSPSLNCLV